MRQTKLLETLQTLSTRERNRWRQFIYSDFCNKHKPLRQLAGLILETENFETAVLHKRNLFARVFGEKCAYNELKINNLLSDLYELLLDWMALERYWADPLEQQYNKILSLLDRRLERHAAVALEKYRLLVERHPQRDALRYRHAARMEEIAEILHSRQPRRSESPHLPVQVRQLQYAHTLEKLQLAVALRSRSQLAVMQSGENLLLSEEIQAIRQDAELLNALPSARTYLAAYDLLEHPGAENLQNLTLSLESNHSYFAREELASLYQCALNHCISRINAGQPDAYADALWLYRTLLERNLLIQQGGRLSQWSYKNIATTGLRSGAFAWTEQFLYQYRDALSPAERENAFAFNLASLYFEKQELALTLQTLQNVEFTDFTYHFGAKMLQLKTFYLLDETEALDSLIASTRQLLRRDKTLSPFGKATNLNFLRVLYQAGKWKSKKNRWSAAKAKKAQLALLQELEVLQPVANKDWLLKILSQPV